VEFNFNIMQREDYSTQQPGQTTTVQLEYSQKFINNRLIVNIGGNFAFQDENSTAENNIAGDFEVEGLLTPDGKLRAKAYHRTADFDIFNQDRSRTGVSIAYQRDFDRIVEVFKVDANKRLRIKKIVRKRKTTVTVIKTPKGRKCGNYERRRIIFLTTGHQIHANQHLPIKSNCNCPSVKIH
jgi:hypothetical protein